MTVDEIFDSVDIDNLTEDMDQTQHQRNLMKFFILILIGFFIWLLFFKPIKHTIPLQIEKVGQFPSSQTFTVVLSDGNGNEIKTMTTNGKSCIIPLKTKPLSSRIYTVKQTGGSDENVIYDYTVYKIRVIGILGIIKPNIKIVDNKGNAKEIKFTNSFREVGSKVYVPVVRATANVDFPLKYAILDENENVVSSITMQEDGVSTIGIPIREEGEYNYTMRDVTDAEDYVKAEDCRIVLNAEYEGKQLKVSYNIYRNNEEKENFPMISSKIVSF